MGRPLKPTALKLLTGNPGKRPLNDQEPKPAPGAVMPKYLMEFPVVVAHWNREAPRLTLLGVLTEVDAQAFGRLCRLWAEDESEWALKGASDPRLLAEIRQLEGRFGMTPSDRGKIKAEPVKPEGKMDRFRRG